MHPSSMSETVVAIQLKIIYWDRAPAAWQAMNNWGKLIKETAREPTHIEELVVRETSYKGSLDASGEGAGGVWLPETKALAPVVWRVE